MKLFRKVLFWCHLATGVGVGVVVFIMAMTGVLLTYERQVIAWADTYGLDGAPPSPGEAPLGIEELLARVNALDAGTPFSLTWRSDPGAPVAVMYSRTQTLYVNAYTGAVLGESSQAIRAFFEGVTDWHRWLGASSPAAGRSITGVCNLAFLFMIVSGFYLWWPRNLTRRAVRNVLFFRRGLSPKARDFNWHNVIGFWSLVPLLVIVLSGVVLSYPWAGNLVQAIAGDAGGGGTDVAASPPTGAAAPADADLEVLFARAAERLPGWRTISLQLPAASDTTVTFTLDRGTGGEPQKRAELTLDRRTAREVAWAPFSAGPPARRLRSILRFAHTGEVLGLAGQTLAGLVSLGAVLLVCTGLMLAWRRFRSWRRRRRRAGAGNAGLEPVSSSEPDEPDRRERNDHDDHVER